jgi:hypothetical protein
MTTNQTPEAAKLAEEAKARLREAVHVFAHDSCEKLNKRMAATRAADDAIDRLAALAEQGQRDSERLRAALQPFADGNWTKELAAKAYAAIEATKD